MSVMFCWKYKIRSAVLMTSFEFILNIFSDLLVIQSDMHIQHNDSQFEQVSRKIIFRSSNSHIQNINGVHCPCV